MPIVAMNAKYHSSPQEDLYIAGIAFQSIRGIKMDGKVKFFDATKEFGFIKAEDGKEYYVNMDGLKQGVTIKDDDDEVSFDVEETDRGPRAVNVQKK